MELQCNVLLPLAAAVPPAQGALCVSGLQVAGLELAIHMSPARLSGKNEQMSPLQSPDLLVVFKSCFSYVCMNYTPWFLLDVQPRLCCCPIQDMQHLQEVLKSCIIGSRIKLRPQVNRKGWPNVKVWPTHVPPTLILETALDSPIYPVLRQSMASCQVPFMIEDPRIPTDMSPTEIQILADLNRTDEGEPVCHLLQG